LNLVGSTGIPDVMSEIRMSSPPDRRQRFGAWNVRRNDQQMTEQIVTSSAVQSASTVVRRSVTAASHTARLVWGGDWIYVAVVVVVIVVVP